MRASLIVCVSVLLSACSARTSGTFPGPDGGVDAGSRDMGIDATTIQDASLDARVADAGRDAGADLGVLDAGPLDAGIDAGADASFDAGFDAGAIDAGVVDAGPRDLGLTSGARRVFKLSTGVTGMLGGLAGADATCQAAADANGLGGVWMAWLSDETEGPATRFITHSGMPYVQTDGTMIASNWADLTDGTLAAGINRTAAGVEGGGNVFFTNTKSDGSPSGANHCSGWTSRSGMGAAGSESMTSTWTEFMSFSCNSLCLLMCFEQ